ncbi:FprA family A-type flavoprotein [Clostridium sardiniense]|uniref:FprA family A-type flavoprotein n=1 Tax=Clostridium sardiniense TaxID=29369 RepID=UPI003D355319
MIKTAKLNENSYCVGKIDDRDVPFHRLILNKGTTYNSYLLKTEKPTIIDTVDMMFGKSYIDNLSELINLEDIKYIVINHTEPDHSGALGSLAMRAKDATIVCTEPAVYELKEMYRLQNRNFLVVKDGDKLDIGGKTLLFKITPYLHTKETMVTYCIEDKTLFSCDIFSTHVAVKDYFNDTCGFDITEDFISYYNAIMKPHRSYVRIMLNSIKDLDIKMICPSHGFIIRKDVDRFIKIYDDLSQTKNNNKKVVIVYTTIKQNTKKVAEMFRDLISNNNIEVLLFNADKDSSDEIIKAIESSDCTLFGTSTRYGDMVGNMEVLLKLLENKDLKGILAGAFGSFGWSGEGIELIQEYLNKTNMNVLNTSSIIKSTGMNDVEFPVRIRFSIGDEEADKIRRAAYYIIDLLLS